MGPTKTTAGAAAVVAVAIAVAAYAVTPPTPDDRWLQLSTSHFTLFSDAGSRVTRRIAKDLEELRATLASYATADGADSQPTYVYVFRDHEAFAPYNLRYQGRPATASGYFTAAGDASYIAIDADSRLDASAIVYHEYLHHFAAHRLAGLPLWFEEGLSELYQSFRVIGREVRLGLPDADHLRRLQATPLIPLPVLLAVNHHSALYNEPEDKTIFYAESWALVHYLLVGNDQRRGETPRFMALVAAGMPQEDAIAAAFATDLDGLQAELERYVQRRIFRYVELPAPPLPDLATSSRPMTRAEALYRLGNRLAQQEGR